MFKNKKLNWNQLYYFSEVAAANSLTGAAEKLEMSPSTLSEHIGLLEVYLETKLFTRSHRKLILTPKGTRLFKQTKSMFELGQKIMDSVSPLEIGGYPVSIALIPSFSFPIVFKILNLFVSEHNDVDMKLHYTDHEDLERNIISYKYDFGFTNIIPNNKDIISYKVADYDLAFFVASRLGSKSFQDLLKTLPLLVFNSQLSGRSPIESFFEEISSSPKSVISSDYPALLLDLCRNGKGIGIFTKDSVSHFKSTGLKEVTVSTQNLKLKEPLYLVWMKDSENSEVIKKIKAILSIKA